MGKKLGRPFTYMDEDIINAIAEGNRSIRGILEALGVSHKTTLINRLRILADQGVVEITPGRGTIPMTVGLVDKG